MNYCCTQLKISEVLKKNLEQIASLLAFDAAMYLALTIDSMIVGCFFADYDMDPPAMLNTNLLIEWHESIFCAQFESVQPTRLILLLLLLLNTNAR